MTLQQIHIKKAERPRLGGICLTVLLLFCIVLMLKRADVATMCMKDGLSLCARTVVPALFPFMVLSEILVTSGVGEWLSAPMERIFASRMLRGLVGIAMRIPHRGKMCNSVISKESHR